MTKPNFIEVINDRALCRRITDMATLLVTAQSEAAKNWHLTELIKVVNEAAYENNSLLRHENMLMRSRVEKVEAAHEHCKQPLRRGTVRVLAMNAGFNLKRQEDGSMDLNEYVYTFANRVRAI